MTYTLPGPMIGPTAPIITEYLTLRLECSCGEAREPVCRVCGVLVDERTYNIAFALLMEWKDAGYLLDEAHFWKGIRARKRFED